LSFTGKGCREGFLFVGIATIVYFILGIKFSDTQVGMLFQGGVHHHDTDRHLRCGSSVWSYMKRRGVVTVLLLLAATTFLTALIVSLFSVPTDWGLVAIIAFLVTGLYLLFLFFRYRKKTYIFIFLFMISSFAFLESVEYVFYDVLQPHQQMRIKVTLGMEQDLSGAGYHVGQSKIASRFGRTWRAKAF